MLCPYCRAETKVLDSRPAEDGTAVRRRRECTACNRRFTTFEKIEELPLLVIKKDGRREPFDREKIITGMMRACQKRPISLETITRAADEIEKAIRNSLEQEVPAETIGEMVMNKLWEIDEVAYVRFASVYRQFKDLNRFMQELTQLLQQKN